MSYITPLEQSFEFSKDDLAENQQGRLTESQKLQLRTISQHWASLMILPLVLIGVLSMITTPPQNASDLVIISLALLCPGILTFFITIGATEKAITEQTVTKITGRVHLAYGALMYDPPLSESQYPHRRFMFARQGAYTLMINNEEYRISAAQFKAIPAGALMNAYVVPSLRKIISMEIIDTPLMQLPIAKDSDIIERLPMMPEPNAEDTLRA